MPLGIWIALGFGAAVNGGLIGLTFDLVRRDERRARRSAELAAIPSPNAGALRAKNGALGADERRAAGLRTWTR